MDTTNLLYKITFFSEWHCGSGLSAGADVDALVIKDSNNLPYVPGKTIKGLFRDTFIKYFDGESINSCSDSCFGEEGGVASSLYFTNAEFKEAEKSVIIDQKLSSYLFTRISSTAIDKDGIAKDGSLRKMEVTIPCELYGNILNTPVELVENFRKAACLIKRIGMNRSRGLGRCDIIIIENQKDI